MQLHEIEKAIELMESKKDVLDDSAKLIDYAKQLKAAQDLKENQMCLKMFAQAS